MHAPFRVVCIITTPFFVGIRGFRSKLWMVDPETADFAGLYEWDDADTAIGLMPMAWRGSCAPCRHAARWTYELIENSTVAEYLADKQGSSVTLEIADETRTAAADGAPPTEFSRPGTR